MATTTMFRQGVVLPALFWVLSLLSLIANTNGAPTELNFEFTGSMELSPMTGPLEALSLARWEQATSDYFTDHFDNFNGPPRIVEASFDFSSTGSSFSEDGFLGTATIDFICSASLLTESEDADPAFLILDVFDDQTDFISYVSALRLTGDVAFATFTSVELATEQSTAVTLAPTAPTSSPSSAPSKTLSASPSVSPTGSPTLAATGTPTAAPTGTPTGLGSTTPTMTPSSAPTVVASGSPSSAPTGVASGSPSLAPTVVASGSPSTVPTTTATPTMDTSPEPTGLSSDAPSGTPTGAPSGTPTGTPSGAPSIAPIDPPTMVPVTTAPTAPEADDKSTGITVVASILGVTGLASLITLFLFCRGGSGPSNGEPSAADEKSVEEEDEEAVINLNPIEDPPPVEDTTTEMAETEGQKSPQYAEAEEAFEQVFDPDNNVFRCPC